MPKTIEAREDFDPAKEVKEVEGKVLFITGGKYYSPLSPSSSRTSNNNTYNMLSPSHSTILCTSLTITNDPDQVPPA